MASEERYVQIRLTEGEIDALKKRSVLNMRPMALEGAMIIKLVLAGKGDAVTVPGVNELNFLGSGSDEGDAGQDGEEAPASKLVGTGKEA